MKLFATILAMAGIGALLLGVGCLRDSKKNEKINNDFEKSLKELEKLIKAQKKQTEEQEKAIRNLNQELINIIQGKYPNVVIM